MPDLAGHKLLKPDEADRRSPGHDRAGCHQVILRKFFTNALDTSIGGTIFSTRISAAIYNVIL